MLVLIADLDIFASATYLEASGTAFAEAAAAKLPVVGTEVGGVPEMMSPGKSGLLVPLHNLSALREALQRLIDDPDLRHQMGQAGNRILNTQKARKAVLITFDDGYLNNWVYAFPLLKKYGFKATIFLVTSWLHHGEVRANTDLSAELPFCPDHHVCEALIAADCSDQVILRWQEAQAMQDSGLIEFHSHTHTHTRWDKIEPQNKNIKMQWELDMSKQKLRKKA